MKKHALHRLLYNKLNFLFSPHVSCPPCLTPVNINSTKPTHHALGSVQHGQPLTPPLTTHPNFTLRRVSGLMNLGGWGGHVRGHVIADRSDTACRALVSPRAMSGAVTLHLHSCSRTFAEVPLCPSVMAER